jgi:dTDP-4-amino-4,6-dideoxygalactose transaminase
MYRRYESALRSVPQVEMLPTSDETAPWFVDIYVPEPERLRDHLKSRMIGSRLVYPPVNKQAIYPTAETFPVTERFCSRGLWLPSASFLTDETIERICAEIRGFFESGARAG